LVRLDRVAADVAIAKVELEAGHAEVEDLVLQRMPERDRARIEEIDRRTPPLPPRPFLPVVDEEAAREGEIVAGRGRFVLDRRALLEIERGRVDELRHPDDDADALVAKLLDERFGIRIAPRVLIELEGVVVRLPGAIENDDA